MAFGTENSTNQTLETQESIALIRDMAVKALPFENSESSSSLEEFT
jgi:hypothetical protein